MKIFHCDHCANLVFFENVECVSCHHLLAYLPDLGVVGSLDSAGENLWKSPLPRATKKTYRLCANYTTHGTCNWAVPEEDSHPLCESCRQTQVIPDLSQPGAKEAWYRIEVAKRRLVYTLKNLGLPLQNKHDDPEAGVAYEFLADPADHSARVLTGHENGLIRLNIAEADDSEREKRRMQLHEPYRTLLGHFRHEIGHYYWDRLIQGSDRLEAFRELFGNEEQDYNEALQHHYQNGPPADWQERFVSAYASTHPWEDWAESWAHYLHMVDTMETAVACGISLKPKRRDEPAMTINTRSGRLGSFQEMIENWFPLTYALNNLNRGMGLADAYPFILSAPAIEKLRFIHDTIVENDSHEAKGAEPFPRVRSTSPEAMNPSAVRA